MRALSQQKAREHFDAAQRMAKLHNVFTVPTVVLSALAGSASINSLGSLGEAGPVWSTIVTTVCSLLVAVLSALTTFFDWRQQQARHTEALNGYHKVLRRVDALLRSDTAHDDIEASLASIQGDLLLLVDATLSHTTYVVT